MADAGEPKGAGVAKRKEEKHDPDFADILGNGAITKRVRRGFVFCAAHARHLFLCVCVCVCVKGCCCCCWCAHSA